MPQDSNEKATLIDKLRFWGVCFFFPFYFFLVAIIYILITLIFKPLFPNCSNWFLRLAYVSLSLILGLKTELRGGHKLEKAPKGIIVMNHQTLWDIYMVISVYNQLGDSIHTVSRKEVFYLWPLGYAMHLSGSLFIDKKTPQAALESLISESKRILAPSNPLKSKVIIFPEGTRNPKTGGDFLQFKRGAFKVAQACSMPIIPIVCSPHIFVKPFKFFRPGNVVIQCLDPVMIDHNDDLDRQIEAIRSNMQQEYTKLMNELGITPEE